MLFDILQDDLSNCDERISMETPVAFIIFNRPDTTARVFAEIAKAKPPKLFVIADGPRPGRPGEAEKCTAARAVIEHVDWECDVVKNYSDVNLGCGPRPSTGISWVFEQVEEAIIFEDDCVPHPTFFRFCEELLQKYCDDERVMQISGCNPLAGLHQAPYSYCFYRIFACWGWATWRRAWQHFDMEMKMWPELRNSGWLQDLMGDPRGVEYWEKIFDSCYKSPNTDSWDYQFLFACWAQNGLAIAPNTNLVSNIGFGDDATHTRSGNTANVGIQMAAIKFPLRHPPHMMRDKELDRLRLESSFGEKESLTLYGRLRNKLSRIIVGSRESNGV